MYIKLSKSLFAPVLIFLDIPVQLNILIIMNEKPSILIVDDEDYIRDTYVSYFKKKGYKVFESRSCKEGIEKFNQYKPQLVIVDIILPDTDGFALIDAIKEDFENVPVIAISGNITMDFKIKSMAKKTDFFLLKPFQLSELGKLVRLMLDKKITGKIKIEMENLQNFLNSLAELQMRTNILFSTDEGFSGEICVENDKIIFARSSSKKGMEVLKNLLNSQGTISIMMTNIKEEYNSNEEIKIPVNLAFEILKASKDTSISETELLSSYPYISALTKLLPDPSFQMVMKLLDGKKKIIEILRLTEDPLKLWRRIKTLVKEGFVNLSPLPVTNVLIIDDNAMFRNLMKQFLGEFNINTITAEDAGSGITLLKKIPVDVVVVDLNLPGMDGIEVIKNIKSIKELPIIVVSGKTGLFNKLKTKQMGVYKFFAKPFEPEELLKTIQSLVSL